MVKQTRARIGKLGMWWSGYEVSDWKEMVFGVGKKMASSGVSHSALPR
jgi:hypothetical protein